MSEVNLKFEVHCQTRRPLWANLNSNSKFANYTNSKYRVYINNDLITERDWCWDNIFLIEDIWITADQNKENILLLKCYDWELDLVTGNNTSVKLISEPANFIIKNFISNTQTDITKINDLQINFILR